jgi:hypothetical protein
VLCEGAFRDRSAPPRLQAEVEQRRERGVAAAGGQINGVKRAGRRVASHEQGVVQLRVTAELLRSIAPSRPPSNVEPGSKR